MHVVCRTIGAAPPAIRTLQRIQLLCTASDKPVITRHAGDAEAGHGPGKRASGELWVLDC